MLRRAYTHRVPATNRKAPVALAALLGVILCVLALVGVGGGTAPVEGLGWVLTSLVYAGGPAAIYLLAALGYGVLIGRWLIAGDDRRLVQPALGLGFMLMLSLVLGELGVLTPLVAAGTCAVGLAALVRSVVVGGFGWLGATPRVGPGWATIPAGCIVFIAASNPPGTLWNSEFGGYDALSYHLELPQEWLVAGRIEPLEHNVYSYLPSAVEAAYLHLAELTDAPRSTGPGEGYGLMAGDGWGVLSCQWLHAGMTLIACWSIGGLTLLVARRAGLDQRGQHMAASVAAGLTLATPWIVVVGSLAYNEMAMAALGAGAVACALLDGTRAWVRGAMVGALVGAACGAKPTAMFLIAPVAGIMVLATTPKRSWAPAILACVAAGALLLSPWLIRNVLHGGNPVFPAAAGLFGPAHWTQDQVARFASGHHFDGSLVDRLRLALWTNPATAPGDRAVERFRGVSNPQWGLFFGAALAASIAAVVVWWRRGSDARVRLAGVVALVLGLGCQLVAWLLLTHIQSRFLIPCVLTGAPLIGIACAWIRPWRASVAVGAACVVVQTTVTIFVWTQQMGGAPTSAMIAGVRTLKGEPFVPALHADIPIPAVNKVSGKDLVYLLGGSTPLYFSCPVLYHTTWDTSPLGELMRAHPGEPWAWAEALRQRGVVYVLADYAELMRLEQSGWYDADVTPDAVMRWLDEVGEPVLGWPNYRQMLYRLKERP